MIDTDLDVFNTACALIGEDPLEDMEEETPGGQAASLVYRTLLKFNIGFYPFSFGTTVRELTRITTVAPATGYLNVHRLPNERLGAPLKIIKTPTKPDDDFTRYFLTEDTLHADPERLWAVIKYLPPVKMWSPSFHNLQVHSLASKLAMIFASDRNTMGDFHVQAYGTPRENYRGGLMRTAINEDSFGTPPKKAQWGNNPLTNAYRGNEGSTEWEQ